ncbi:MAG: tRNA (guanosine(46)-N7)-methyltransferase TrmB [Pleomorphochaeta sp.]
MREKAQSLYDEYPELAIVEKKDLDNKNREVHSFVIRTNKLHTFQLEAVKNYYDHYVIRYKDEIMDFKKIFNNDKPVIIEIGFGTGESTHRIAKDRSQFNYIAIEVFLNGFTKLLSVIGNENIENVRLMRFDAVAVLNDMIADGSVHGFHIFFPDPWPKKKHHKRRLIQTPFTNLLSKKLKTGGYIYCVTDWQEYAQQMLEVLTETNDMTNSYNGYSDSREWRPTTKYERRGVKLDYNINEVWFEKE